MLVKLTLPQGAKVIQNEPDSMVIDIEEFQSHFASFYIFTVAGHTLEHLEDNPLIEARRIHVFQAGNIKVTVEHKQYQDEFV